MRPPVAALFGLLEAESFQLGGGQLLRAGSHPTVSARLESAGTAVGSAKFN